MLAARLQPPSWPHPFGTDNFGRDILSRVIWGARIDLQIAVIGVVFPFLIGTLVGTVAGYFGGIVDIVFMRLVDIILAFPFLVLMLSIIAILGPGLGSFYIAMALVGWVSYARLIRAQMLVLKNRDYAVAAVSLGFSRAADHVPPPAAERDRRLGRLRHVGRGAGAAERRGDQLSRPRRPAADRRMGRDGRRGPSLHHHRLVDHAVSRPGHRRRWPSPSACSATGSPNCWGCTNEPRRCSRSAT